MPRISINYAAALLCGMLWPCTVSAGAWPQKPGHLQLIVPATHTWATEDYDASGDSQRRNRFSKNEIQPYLEYGFLENLTLVGSLALTQEKSSWLGTKTVNRGLSRVEVGARWALGTWQDTHFSVQPMLIWHGSMSQDDPFASKRGDVDSEFGITMGQHFELWGYEGFSDNLIAYRLRPGDRLDEAKVNLTLGVTIKPGRQIMLKSESLANVTHNDTPGSTPIQSNKLGLALVQRLDEVVSVEVSYMSSLTGRNTIKEQSLGVALWYDF